MSPSTTVPPVGTDLYEDLRALLKSAISKASTKSFQDSWKKVRTIQKSCPTDKDWTADKIDECLRYIDEARESYDGLVFESRYDLTKEIGDLCKRMYNRLGVLQTELMAKSISGRQS